LSLILGSVNLMAQDISLAQELEFRPRWHWDPVPPFLREHLDFDVIRELTTIQLQKQLRILEIEQIAIKDTLNAVQNLKAR
jgi:hypothetical protein